MERKQETTLEVITIDGNNGGQIMNTQEKIINDLAIQLANKTIECANYKALYEEAQAEIQKLQEDKEKEE